MDALAAANEGIALMAQGNLLDTTRKFIDASSRLQEAQKEVITQTAIISWFAGIKSEVNLVESLKTAVDGEQAGIATGLSAMESVKRLETYSRAFENSRKAIGPLLHSGDRIRSGYLSRTVQ